MSNPTTKKLHPMRLVDLKVGDEVAIDFDEMTTDYVVEAFEETGDFETGVVKEIKILEAGRSTVFTVTFACEDGDWTEEWTERPGCYCGCRDYYCSVVLLPEGVEPEER